MAPSEKTPVAVSSKNKKQSENGLSEATPLLAAAKGKQGTDSNTVKISDENQEDKKKKEEEKKKLEWGRILKFMLPYAMPYSIRLRLLTVSALVLTVLVRILSLVPPYAIKIAVDSVSNHEPKPPLGAITLYFGANMLRTALSSLDSIGNQFLHSEIRQNFAVDAFRHLHHLDMTYHLNQKSGRVSRIIWRGSYGIETLMDIILFNAMPTLIESMLVIIIFFKLGTPLISLIVFVGVLLYWLISKISTDVQVDQRRENNKILDECYSKEVDTLINVETVKVFGMEDFEVNSYDSLRTRAREMKNSFSVVSQGFSFAKSLVQSGAGTCALALAAVGASNGKLSAGDFVIINAYIGQLFSPLLALSHLYSRILNCATSVEDVIKVFERESLIKDRDHATQIYIEEEDLRKGCKGELSFENVSFTYKSDSGANGGVKHLSFKVSPGHMLGIVGHSGSGKSTLIKLVTRLFEPDEGQVKIDGIDIREYTQSSLRRLFGIVSQDTSLFNNSIRYNVSYGKPGANDAEVWGVIRAAALGDFCAKLPDQLDTLVGERGVRLSGGEKQRVGVARCLIRSPAFVILDEASSALDSKTEREMQTNIRHLCRGRTTIAVAHRLSTIMMADEIIVMENSSIIERGTHAQLIEMGGTYRQMWETQTSSSAGPNNKPSVPGK